MRTYNNSIVIKFDTTATGNAGAGKPVTVYEAGTVTKAELFNAAEQTITNPINADNEGNYSFKVANGIYDIVIDQGLPTQVKIENELITDAAGGGSGSSAIETIELTSGQVLVQFAVNTEGASFYINGTGADNGRILESVNYSYNQSLNQVTLTNSYPSGTYISAIRDTGYINEDYVRYFDELSDAVTSTKLAIGDQISLKERTAGNGGGGMWSVVLASTVTPNTFNIVACTGVPSLALVLRINGNAFVDQFGAIGDFDHTQQTGTDDTAALFAAKQYAKDNLVGVELTQGKAYKFTASYIMTGSEYLYGNNSQLWKDFAGKGIQLQGGPFYNYIYDLIVYTTDAQKAAQYEPASSDHGIAIESNRSEFHNVQSIGHKGWGIYLNIDSGNGNKPLWDNVKALQNGQGGIGVFGTQDDNSVGRAQVECQLNYGPGFHTALDCTLRQWVMWIYSENNWVNYAGATVYGTAINKAVSCVFWIYAEEQGANASEILIGDNCTFCEITSARTNLDQDTSDGSNIWHRGNRVGGPASELGATNRRILSEVDFAAGARRTSSTEYVERQFASNEGIFGRLRGQGDGIPGQYGLRMVSDDESAEVGVANGIIIQNLDPAFPRYLRLAKEANANNHLSVGAEYDRLFWSQLKSASEAFNIVDLTGSHACGKVTVISSSSTDLGAIEEIEFEYLDGVLTQATTKQLGAFANRLVVISDVAGVLTLTLTENLGATVRFSGSVSLKALKY